MKPASLTRELVTLADGRGGLAYEWQGEPVIVCDDARSIIKAITITRDDDLTAEEKSEQFLRLIFEDPNAAFLACDFSQASFAALVDAVMKDVYGIEAGDTGPKIWDIEEDADLIRVSFRMAYGIDWDASNLTWSEFVSLVGLLPISTPLGRAKFYRDPENRPTGTSEHDKEQQREFDRLHDLLALEQSSHTDIDAQSAAMADLAQTLLNAR